MFDEVRVGREGNKKRVLIIGRGGFMSGLGVVCRRGVRIACRGRYSLGGGIHHICFLVYSVVG